MAGNSSKPQLQAFISLTEPRHLLEKLEHDYERLVNAGDPIGREAQYAAFDFFVTAEHLCDWQKHTKPGTRLTQLRDYPDGALVSHLASGAKHFRADDPRHVAANGTRVSGAFFGRGYFGGSYFGQAQLVIDLQDGSTATVLDVAARVLAHWSKTIV
jgi:hypothetical protein